MNKEPITGAPITHTAHVGNELTLPKIKPQARKKYQKLLQAVLRPPEETAVQSPSTCWVEFLNNLHQKFVLKFA